jgi:transposase
MTPVLEPVELSMQDLEAFLARLKEQISAEDHDLAEKLVGSYLYLTDRIGQDRTTIAELRRLLGKTRTKNTEKTRDVVGAADGSKNDNKAGTAATPTGDKQKKKQKGHGRHAADAYRGATRVAVPHTGLKPGGGCPNAGCKGKVYEQKKPGVIVRITGQAPLAATVYELQKLRCNLCGDVFTANAPADVGEKKYDTKAAAVIALLKYGSGLPFNRLEGLQKGFHIPLPASTQWDIVNQAAGQIEPVYTELIRHAAQGEVVYNDDTSVKILELMTKSRAEVLASESHDGASADRNGIFTSGIVSTREGRKIALFFSGWRHAGENLKEVLRRRASELDAPIQMCDGLSRNLPRELEVVLANCIAHSRRYFVDVAGNFPDACRHVLEELATVYKNDADAHARKLSPEERLRFHQEESAPVMDRLHTWLQAQLEEKKVEPNSGLGTAIKYTLNRWERLTLFLRVAGAPLDNNICERALKKAILHRKNALFYKTTHGAHVGDLFMSLIYTCQLARTGPFEYLTSLLEHPADIADRPQDWLPWSFHEARRPAGDAPAG